MVIQPGIFVNFQLKLYLFSEKLEYHYGPSNVTSNNVFDGGLGPVVNFSWLSFDFYTGIELYWLTGDPDTPSVALGVNQQILGGVPSENTLFRFYVEDTTSSGFYNQKI